MLAWLETARGFAAKLDGACRDPQKKPEERPLPGAGTMLPGDVGVGVSPHRGDPAMCTCRMGRGEHAVVDQNLKVFGAGNLYLVSSAMFPSGAAADPPPTLTVTTL